MGATVVAVSDVQGAAYDSKGLDTQSIPSHQEQPEQVTNYGSSQLSNDELLTLDVDILIPAAIGNVITEDNADQIEADIVVEGANGPTTIHADKILNEKQTPVIPDILANAGGVTVSYYEWVQDLERKKWTLEEVNTELANDIEKAWNEIVETYNQKDNLTWRNAATIVALERLNNTMELRGLWP